MRFTKPAWVIHDVANARGDQTKAKRATIYSVHVHPDGSRIATGGLDAKIRIWSTKPILNSASELSNKPPKLLCTLTMHTGPVLTVRWAHSGRWLASGSDDAIVMIWDLDPRGRGRVWGSDEVNYEGWKPLKRLPGHDSDVTDVAWSPGDRYLASVGLDSRVIIWCGFTLECLHRLDQHQGFVKGVCWDPVGEFLATQSDDRSVKIWRTSDWGLEAEVTKPFEDSPGSTFFRRLSWSPDGAHITASNATNNKGFVFIAAVITRNSWTSEISLVGHENTVEVASYNPHIFLRDPSKPVATSNICSVVALGADDRSVSVWQTKSARPLIVAKEVFERQIMDLSWSWDGFSLYAVSSDGTLAAFHFDPEELAGLAPHSVQDQYLTKFGYVPPPLPEGFSHNAPPPQMTPPPSPGRQQPAALPNVNGNANPSVNGPPPSTANVNGERVNVLVAKRSHKKRNGGTLRSANAIPPQPPSPSRGMGGRDHPMAPAMAGPSRTSSSSMGSASAFETASAFDNPSIYESASMRSSFFAPPEQARDRSEWGMDTDDVRIDALDNVMASPLGLKGKRKASTPHEEGKPSARTLGGDRPVPQGQMHARQLAAGGMLATWGTEAPKLPLPRLLTYLSAEVEGTQDTFDAVNSDNDAPTEVMGISRKQTMWLDYLPSPALLLQATPFYCAVAMVDGSVNVYTHTGRRLMPTMALGSPAAFMDGYRHALMVITAAGQVYSWDVKSGKAFFPPVSVTPVLQPDQNIVAASVRHNGVPVLNTSAGTAYAHDPSLSTWVKVSERWWSEGSNAWSGRQRSNAQHAIRGPMAAIESSISVLDESAAVKPRPQWWESALTLGHLETRMLSTRLLDSPQEYKQALLVYAKRIADEGFRGKAEELAKELFGPIYWRPGRNDTNWTPTVLGWAKRDLLKEVLSIFVRSRTLSKLGMDYQDMLKKSLSEE
ncbi:WD40-repeat-containing domain protein [Schizophyllum commune]